MSAHRGPRGAIADLSRQARELLGAIRDSRWPGFEPERTGPGARQRAPQPRPGGQPPAPLATVPPREEPGPWGSLEQVAEAVAACTKCPLHATRTKTVPGEGNPRARLMFVGEAPGAEEDARGRPFVGAAGQLLDKMIVAMGFARGEVFIANVLKCRPPGNRDPRPDEVAACLPYLRAQIALVAPETICTLGKPASHALLEVTTPITRLRGRFASYRGTPVMPTFHPSYLLRTPGDRKLAWLDLQEIMQRLGLPLPAPSQSREET